MKMNWLAIQTDARNVVRVRRVVDEPVLDVRDEDGNSVQPDIKYLEESDYFIVEMTFSKEFKGDVCFLNL